MANATMEQDMMEREDTAPGEMAKVYPKSSLIDALEHGVVPVTICGPRWWTRWYDISTVLLFLASGAAALYCLLHLN